MAFMIYPTLDTFDALPDTLRPTGHQMHIAHHIGIGFCPIPAMRTSLVKRVGGQYWDWVTIFAVHNLRNNWTGKLGIYQSELADRDHGNSKYPDAGVNGQGAMSESEPDHSNLDGADMLMQARRKTHTEASAVIQSSRAGRRILSSAFENHVFDRRQWSVNRSILQDWPELDGHITFNHE